MPSTSQAVNCCPCLCFLSNWLFSCLLVCFFTSAQYLIAEVLRSSGPLYILFLGDLIQFNHFKSFCTILRLKPWWNPGRTRLNSPRLNLLPLRFLADELSRSTSLHLLRANLQSPFLTLPPMPNVLKLFAWQEVALRLALSSSQARLPSICPCVRACVRMCARGFWEAHLSGGSTPVVVAQAWLGHRDLPWILLCLPRLTFLSGCVVLTLISYVLQMVSLCLWATLSSSQLLKPEN